LASSSGPDIFSINNSWLPKYLNKVVAAPPEVFNLKTYKDTFVDVAVEDFTRDGEIYGVPLAVDSLALYYNKDLLGTVGIATPPKTWNELATDVARLTRQDRTGYFTRSGVAMGLNTNVNRAVDIVYLLMLQAGVIPWNQDNTSPMFTQSVERNGNVIQPATRALAYYTSFADPRDRNYTWNSRSDYSIDAFANGRAAMLYGYAYTRQVIEQKAPNLNFDVAPVPQFDLEGPSVNFANYFGEVVSRQSAHPEVAWDFLKFISSKEVLDRYGAVTGQPSSRKDIIELQITDPDIGVFAHANLTARSLYKPDQARMDDIFANAIDDILLRGLDVDQAISQAESRAAALAQDQ
jgi:multiple sugar transport system substrate-binding protein